MKTLFTMRGTVVRTTGLTPFEMHMWRKQPNRINNMTMEPHKDNLNWNIVKEKLSALEHDQEIIEECRAKYRTKTLLPGEEEEIESTKVVQRAEKKKMAPIFNKATSGTVVGETRMTVFVRDDATGKVKEQAKENLAAWPREMIPKKSILRQPSPRRRPVPIVVEPEWQWAESEQPAPSSRSHPMRTRNQEQQDREMSESEQDLRQIIREFRQEQQARGESPLTNNSNDNENIE